MSDLKTNIDPGAQSGKDWSIVHQVEKVKLEREKKLVEEAKKRQPDTLLFGALCAYCNRVFAFLASAKNRNQTLLVDNISDLIQYLSILREVLHQLAEQDHSFEPEFIQKLSDAWHSLLEAFGSLELIERKKKEEVRCIKLFIEEVRHFPTGREHSLGFYLTEFAGIQWLPFPFMKLLHSLHEEHQQKENNSQLSLWNRQIGHLIDLLAPKADS